MEPHCPAASLVSLGRGHRAMKTLTVVLLGTSPALPQTSSAKSLTAKPGHRGGGVVPSSSGAHPLGKYGQDSPCPLLSFQVTSASLEATTAVHAPAREPEPWPGAPAESTPRGPRTAQEPGPPRCQQSGVPGADLAGGGTGRHGRFPVSGCWRGSCVPSREGGSQH